MIVRMERKERKEKKRKEGWDCIGRKEHIGKKKNT